jgi:hypothetical protein
MFGHATVARSENTIAVQIANLSTIELPTISSTKFMAMIAVFRFGKTKKQ